MLRDRKNKDTNGPKFDPHTFIKELCNATEGDEKTQLKDKGNNPGQNGIAHADQSGLSTRTGSINQTKLCKPDPTLDLGLEPIEGLRISLAFALSKHVKHIIENPEAPPKMQNAAKLSDTLVFMAWSSAFNADDPNPIRAPSIDYGNLDPDCFRDLPPWPEKDPTTGIGLGKNITSGRILAPSPSSWVRIDRTKKLPSFACFDAAFHRRPKVVETLAYYFWPICENLAAVRRKGESQTWLKYVKEDLLPPSDTVEVTPSNKPDRIIPSLNGKQNVSRPSVSSKNPKEVQLPLFEPSSNRVPLLEICDHAGIPVTDQGRGAVYLRRALILILLQIKQEDRKDWASLTLSAAQFMDQIWPPKNGRRQWRPSQHWPKTQNTLERLGICQIFLQDNFIWRPIYVEFQPYYGRFETPKKLDNLPIKFHTRWHSYFRTDGPTIPFAPLVKLGTKSGPTFNLAFGARSLLWKPGITWVPQNKAKKYWDWSKNPERYPILTLKDRRRLAFGTKAAADYEQRKNRKLTSKKVNETWADEDLAKVQVSVHNKKAITPDGTKGYRIVPTEIL